MNKGLTFPYKVHIICIAQCKTIGRSTQATHMRDQRQHVMMTYEDRQTYVHIYLHTCFLILIIHMSLPFQAGQKTKAVKQSYNSTRQSMLLLISFHIKKSFTACHAIAYILLFLSKRRGKRKVYTYEIVCMYVKSDSAKSVVGR